jgi:hypothetical protein
MMTSEDIRSEHYRAYLNEMNVYIYACMFEYVYFRV